MKLDHPRQLAVMHALVRFAHIAGGDTFTTKDLHPAAAAAALDVTTEQYQLASLRYDLSKLRAKHLIDRVAHSRRPPCLARWIAAALKVTRRVRRTCFEGGAALIAM